MKDLDKIREHLAGRPRDLLLFELALQTEVPVQNLLDLKVGDVRALDTGDALPASIAPNDMTDPRVVNDQIAFALKKLLKETRPQASDFLFKSRKKGRPLSVPSVSRIIRGWREETGLTHFGGLPDLRQAQKRDKQKKDSNSDSVANQTLLPKVQTRTIQEIVYKELEEAILSGKIPPGQKLIAEEISRMMDVSRIPVREAMGRLEARGLITTRPKWGSTVNELSRENLKEVSEIRISLEPQAAEKAAGRVDEAFLTRLEKAHAAFARARKGTASDLLLKTNRQFHFLIYKQANSPILLDIINQLWDRVSPYYHIMFRQALDRSPNIGVSYHEHIFESLKQKDKKAVQHWLRADLTDSMKYILNLFDLYNAQ